MIVFEELYGLFIVALLVPCHSYTAFYWLFLMYTAFYHRS